MPATAPEIAVIVPTVCARKRAHSLRRAITSITSQGDVSYEIIAVVNGPTPDPELLAWLTAQPFVRVVREPKPSLPNALALGREQVRAPCFGFLDDDDELLPDTLRVRASFMAAHPDVDVFVGSGYWQVGTADQPRLIDCAEARRDPLISFLQLNWLASCAGTFRTARVQADVFWSAAPYREWTSIGFRLLTSGCTFEFTELPIYRVADSPGSLSKTEAYALADLACLRSMTESAPTEESRALLRRRLSVAFHDHAQAALVRGERRTAWRWHAQSLIQRGGWRFLPFTRRLLIGLIGVSSVVDRT